MPMPVILGGSPPNGPVEGMSADYGASFAERLKDWASAPGETEEQAAKRMAAFDELTRAAANETMLARLTSSRAEALAEAAQRRIETVQQQTGVQLENPFRQGYLQEAERRYDDARTRGEDPGPRALAVRAFQRDIFNEKIDGVAAQFPGKAAALQFFQPMEEQAGAIATSAEDAAQTARARYRAAGGGVIGEFGAELLGGLAGARRDPVTITSLFAGPTVAAGRSALARILTAGAAQGLTNLGLLALEKPAVKAWREERGLPGGDALPSLPETGLAFALGFIPGAAAQGGIEAAGRAASRAITGAAGRQEIEKALRGLGGAAERETVATLEAGQRSIAADEAILAERPAGAAEADFAASLRQQAAHAADPANEPPGALLPIEAYHGSPHDFEAFDLSRIGTGEGQQSYGHGLYLAESPDVAQQYRERLAAKDLVAPEGNVEVRHEDGMWNVYVDGGLENAFGAESDARRYAARGQLYKVRINAGREHFLDWDKPLSEQSEAVQQALRRLGVDHGDPSGADAYHALTEQARTANIRDHGAALQAGREFEPPDPAAVASRSLREAGIPGIKYLDQGSRGAGDGTQNFVVFDDKLIEITHKNGAPLGPKAGAGMMDDVARAVLAAHADPVAGAEALRADPKLVESALSSPDASVRISGRLANLSDEAFAMVRAGEADPLHGAIVAEATPRPDWHAQVLDAVTRSDPPTPGYARLVAAEAVEGLSNREAIDRAALENALGASDRAASEGIDHVAVGADDPLGKVAPADGGTALVPRAAIVDAGARDGFFADLVRSCK